MREAEAEARFSSWSLFHPQDLLCMVYGIETSFSLLFLLMGCKSVTVLSGLFHVLHRTHVRRRTCLCCVIIALFSVKGSRRLKELLCLETHTVVGVGATCASCMGAMPGCKLGRVEAMQWTVKKWNFYEITSVLCKSQFYLARWLLNHGLPL